MKRTLFVITLSLAAVWIALGAASPSVVAQPPAAPVSEPETSITSAITRTPIIFIHGIQGSRLFNTVDGQEQEVWLKWTNILPVWENRLDVLRLAADGDSPLNPNDPAYATVHTKPGSAGLLTDLAIDLRDIGIPLPNPVYDMPIYSPILAYFKSRGYSETVDLWVYPFDWRKDVRQSADGLDVLVDQILSQTGQSQVYIVAHSMGGLVSRMYINDTGRAAKVKRLMTLGTPYLGTPLAPQVLLEGDCLLDLLSLDLHAFAPIRICLPSVDKSKSLVPNLPGFYTLFPSRSYFTVKGGGFYGMPTESNPSGACPSCLNFTQTYTSTVLPPLNSSIFQSVDGLHNLIDARPGDAWNGVPVDIVVGNGQTTIVGIQPQKRVSLNWPFYTTVHIPIEDKYGDGTVALFSGAMSNGVNGVNLRGTATYKEFPDDHLGLTQDCLVWAYIDQKLGLTGSDPCTIPQARHTAAAAVPITPTVQIVAFNAASIEAVDAQGRRTGPLTTTAASEEGIPGSAYDAGETQSESLTLWGGVPYTITIQANGQGAVDVITWRSTLSNVITTTYQAGISATAQSTFILSGDPFVTNAWQIDLDGNGVPDTTPPHTLTYGDGVAQDHTSPTITISIDGVLGPQGWYTQPVTVTLSATDDLSGTGLARLEYFFSHDRVMRRYTDPFVADPRQGVLYAFATDQAINQHEPVAVRLGPEQLHLPLMARNSCGLSVCVGWAVGGSADGYGTILRTTDSGVTWVRQGRVGEIPDINLNGVSAVDAQHAWAVGGQSILRTSDGGLTWITQTLPAGLPDALELFQIKALDTRTAFAVGNLGVLLQTNDGTTWMTMPTSLDMPLIQYSDVDAVDATHVWAVGGVITGTDPRGGLAIAFYDGAQWQWQGNHIVITRTNDCNSFIGVSMVDQDTAWAVGGTGLSAFQNNRWRRHLAGHRRAISPGEFRHESGRGRHA